MVDQKTQKPRVAMPKADEETLRVDEVSVSVPIHQLEDEDIESDEEEEMDDAVGTAVEDLDPNEILWQDGPTAGQVIQWKEQHGDVYVTSFDFAKDHYLWRTLTRGEYRAIMQNLERIVGSGKVSQSEANMDNEETITEMCLLFPRMNKSDFKGSKAGIPTALSEEILEASGFKPIDIRQL